MIADHWTKEELEREFSYRMQERLGILCGRDEETPEQLAEAMNESDEAVELLKEQNQ